MFKPLTTARVMLRPLVPEDAEAVFAYRADPRVTRYQNWIPASAEEVRTFLAGLANRDAITRGAWFQLGIVWRETGGLAGDCGIHPGVDDPRQVELGISVAPSFQRRGLAREALTLVLDFLFSQTDTHRVHCSVDPRNLPCIALLQKIGLRQEAHLVESLCIRDEWLDDMIFAILRREWRSPGGPGN